MSKLVKIFVFVFCFIGYAACMNELPKELSGDELVEVKDLICKMSKMPSEEVDSMIAASDTKMTELFGSVESFREFLFNRYDGFDNRLGKIAYGSSLAHSCAKIIFWAGCGVFSCKYRPFINGFVSYFTHFFRGMTMTDAEIVNDPTFPLVNRLNEICCGREWFADYKKMMYSLDCLMYATIGDKIKFIGE